MITYLLVKEERKIQKLNKHLPNKEIHETHSGRMSAEERREQLLEVAVGLFSDCGFSGTTTKQIANAAGISEAMIFRHFSTKDDLYKAILEKCKGGMKTPPWEKDEKQKQAFEQKNDYEFFYHFALKALDHQQKDVDFMRLLFHSALEKHELSQIFFEQFVSPIYEFLGSYISRRQSDGAFRKVEPRVVVRAFLGMIIHHSLNNILWDESQRLLRISNEEAAREFTSILLNGVKNN